MLLYDAFDLGSLVPRENEEPGLMLANALVLAPLEADGQRALSVGALTDEACFLAARSNGSDRLVDLAEERFVVGELAALEFVHAEKTSPGAFAFWCGGLVFGVPPGADAARASRRRVPQTWMSPFI